MSLFSLEFLGFALCFIVAFRLFPTYRWRAGVALAFNTLFLFSFVPSLSAALPLIAFVLLGFIGTRIILRWPNRKVMWGQVFGFVLLFVWLRQYSLISFLPDLPGLIVTVGLSYILFRILHLLFDSQDGAIENPIRFVDYVNYTIGFLTFVSGPIDRFQKFSENFLQVEPIDSAGARAAIARIVLGYARVMIVSAVALYVFDNITSQFLGVGQIALPKVILLYCVSAASYTAYLYMNFAGYMDIVIGIGALAGLRIPENFNKPFLTRSQIEFWGCWHITLSEWFKHYAFYPILQSLMIRIPAPQAAPVLGVLTYFLVFLMIGLWHGSTNIFLVYGFVLGLGVSLNKLWQVVLAAWLGNKSYRELSRSALYTYWARGVNIAYFMIALTAFWVSFDQLLLIHAQLGLFGWLAAFVSLVLFWIAVSAGLDLWGRLTERPLENFRFGSAPAVLSTATTSMTVIIILAVQSILNAEPEFVYAAF